jgi:Ser/Thr protein kinase RdoA (MazF antagonist)
VARTLHAIPLAGESRGDLAELVRRKIQLRAESLRGEVSPAVAIWAHRLADASGWDRLRVGACHRDFSPRNWMVSPPPGETVTLIDFEHAEFDFLAVDAMKLWDGPFVGRPDLRRAFYAGYGQPLADAEREIRLVAPAHGLAILAWSLERGDFAYAAHGRAFLERAAASDLWFRA